MVADRHVLDPLRYYSFTHQMQTWTHGAASELTDVQWRLRHIELDNRWLANCELPVRLKRRIFTRAKHRVQNRHWLDLVEFPRIAKGLVNMRLITGQNAEMVVRVRGSPDVKVRWCRDWLPLVENEHVFIRHFRDDEYVLTIRDVRTRDAGLYACIASNMSGTVRTIGQLDVRQRLDYEAIPAKEENEDNMCTQ